MNSVHLQFRLSVSFILLVFGFISPASAGIKTHCLGKGPLLYLIGGGPAFTTWNLQPIQKKLAVDYKVCRWDMRGVGENADLNLSSELSALSQWLEDMQTVLPQQPVTLWGHSWGALQSLLFAKQYPQRVRRVILSNPVDPHLRSLEHIELKLFVHPEIDAKLSLEDIGTAAEERHILLSKIASYFLDAEQGWEYASKFQKSDANNALNIRIWDEYREAPLSDSDLEQLAEKVTDLIYCQDDLLQPESFSEYHRLLGQSKHHILTGCAHFPWEENPLDYYRILSSLLKK